MGEHSLGVVGGDGFARWLKIVRNFLGSPTYPEAANKHLLETGWHCTSCGDTGEIPARMGTPEHLIVEPCPYCLPYRKDSNARTTQD